MRVEDNFLVGFVAGAITCTAAFLLTEYTGIVSRLMPEKPVGLYIIAVAINFVLVWICYRNGLEKSGKGLVFSTFIGLLLLVFLGNTRVFN